MSSTLEQRVVQMVFDTSRFGPKIQEVLNQLSQLKEGLKLQGASQGIQEVSSAADRFSLNGMKNEVSGMAAHFTALQVAAATALSNIVNKAVDAGLQLAKSLTIEPLTAGFKEYETNLNSIQTILANTGLKGAEGLATVTAKLDELNQYSDQTIYNFSEMAKNIGTFTAAGVNLDVATSAIKGIANLAAISGSNAEQASAAMYQLSQALAAGKVTLEDWNSVVNAGMGGKVFQDSLIETARVHGVQVDDMIKKQGSFRLSLEKGWLTTDILTETLSKFTGELSAEQLKSMGYTEQQAQDILAMGQTAVDAATKVKTVTQLMGTLREAVGSGWAKTWQIVFGDFDEAKMLFTNVSNTLGKMIGDAADARNELLQGWKDMGGRAVLIEGISNVFTALLAVLKPIKEAFREIFPATTANQLFELTNSFKKFTEGLTISGTTANDLRRTFAGFFAVLGIGWEFVKAGIGFIGDLISKFSGGSGSVLRFTGNIGDFLVALHKAIQGGDAFGKFFDFLSKAIDVPLKMLKDLGRVIAEVFSKMDTDPLVAAMGKIVDSTKPLGGVGEQIQSVWAKVLNGISNGLNAFVDVAGKVWSWLSKVASGIADFFSKLNFDDVMKGVNAGLLAGVLAIIYKFIDAFNLFGQGSFLDGIKETIEGFTNVLGGMQHALNGAALLAIALAIGVLALSFDTLSKIDAAGLQRAGIALTIVLAQLATAFVAFSKLSGGAYSSTKLILMATALTRLGVAVRLIVVSVEALAKIPLGGLAKGLTGVIVLLAALVAAANFLPSVKGMFGTSIALLAMALAIRLLVESVEPLAQLSWEELAKGLVGVGVLLASLALFTRLAEADKGGISQGLGIILLATALKILASAVGDFVQFNWEQLGRGMAAIAVGLGLITAAMNLLPNESVSKALGVLIVAAALKIIASAVEDMAKMSWMEIARGMTVMAGSLLAIALALAFLPPDALMSAAAILVVAVSLGLIQDALADMAKMSWEEIAKGLVTLAGALLIIGLAVYAMQTAIAGAAAIAIVAVALTLLVPVLQALGQMTWEEIVKGLVALAGVFIILGAAGYILAPLSPVILALAGSIALLGLAVLAVGLGVLTFAVGLSILATAGAGATVVLIALIAAMIALIPQVMEAIAQGLIAVARVIAESGPAMKDAMVAVLKAFMDAIIELTPKIVDLIKTLTDGMFKVLIDYIPKMVDAGYQIVTGVLEGMGNRVEGVIDAAVELVVKYLGAIGDNLPKVIQAGVDLVLAAVNGIADGIRNNGAKVGEAGVNLASALVEGIIRGIGAALGRAVQAAVDIGKAMFDGAKAALGINSPSKKFIPLGEGVSEGMAVGTLNASPMAEAAAVTVGENMIDSMAKTLDGMSKILGSDLIDFEPTITPVLDLSNVKKEAQSLGDILAMQNLDVSSTYKKAQSAGFGYEANRATQNFPGEENPVNSITYIQNNTSPKALNNEEIYRQSNNLISKKGGKNA